MKPFSCLFASLLATTVLSLPSRLGAQTTTVQTTLYSFTGGTDGDSPEGGLIQGSDGNFYGTTYLGGGSGVGTIFRISPAGVLTTLHSFSGGADEGHPVGALVQGSDGNFYGTANGSNSSFGTIFKITPAGVFTTLHSLSANTEGKFPYAALVQGSDSNFYGTATQGGSSGDGTVFKISPAGALTTLHNFTGTDGSLPETALVRGSDGNFYSVTTQGGSGNQGTIFRMTSAGTLTTLHSFTGADGKNPDSLVQGSDGNFYGTTYYGGSNNVGTIFRISLGGAFTTLYNFKGGVDGKYPDARLVQASDGNFYGTTGFDPNGTTNGTIFRMTSTGVLTTLYTFSGGVDGENPGPLLQSGNGIFYGTTALVGTSDHGTFFEFALTSHPAFFSGEILLGSGVYYLSFFNGDFFGYYGFLNDPHYIYHFDLGYEYVFDANDGKSGVYLYDFASSTFFYTSPTFPFPYLYDFTLNTVLYYYPNPNDPGHYNTDGVRYFYDFAASKIITK